MVTLLFILIAFALRKRYLPEDSPVLLKLLYYGCFVMLTPVIGILLFRNLDWNTPGDTGSGGGCGWIFPNVS